jgi:hypothetical protein
MQFPGRLVGIRGDNGERSLHRTVRCDTERRFPTGGVAPYRHASI